MRSAVSAAKAHARFTSRSGAAALAGLLAVMLQPLPASAAVGDASGDVILGQPNDFSSSANNPRLDAESLNVATYSTFDAAGNLFVADSANNRVLIYLRPMTTDRVADRVIGQPDFNSDTSNNGGVSASTFHTPMGVAIDATGTLWVADHANNRVLAFDAILTTDAVADRIIGQPDSKSKTENNGGISAASLRYPIGVALDRAGNLYVADYGNNRVLEYNNPVATSDRVADLVFGQPSFSSTTANATGVSATSMNFPRGVAIDANNNLWVADHANSRVLEFDRPMVLGTTADRVLGQPNLTSSMENSGGVSASSLRYPSGVAADANGNIYVADTLNNRTLFYTNPISTSDRIADRVYGQSDFQSKQENNGGVSAASAFNPMGVAVSPTGDVAIGDFGNSRVILIEAPAPIVTSIQVKLSPSGTPKLIVSGHGMLNGFAVVTVDSVPLATFKYKVLEANGSAGKVTALDRSFDAMVPKGVQVIVRVSNPGSGVASAPIPFTR
jgi:sugar lactone lactonase YvrE